MEPFLSIITRKTKSHYLEILWRRNMTYRRRHHNRNQRAQQAQVRRNRFHHRRYYRHSRLKNTNTRITVFYKNHKAQKTLKIKNLLKIMLRLVFSHSEFQYCYHKISLIFSSLIYPHKIWIFPINVFETNFDKNWFRDGCLERNS